MTSVCQIEYDKNGNVFIDTPGLSDVKQRKLAAQEIKKGFSQGGLFRIFFWFTLESGRIRPDDKTTMKLILDAAPIKTNQYSIIINKVPQKTVDKWSEDDIKEYIVMLTEGLTYTTNSIFVLPFDPDLMDEENALPELSDDFLNFINHAPTLIIEKDQVKDIKESEFEQIKKEMNRQFKEIRKDKQALQKRFDQLVSKYQKLMANYQEALRNANKKRKSCSIF